MVGSRGFSFAAIFGSIFKIIVTVFIFLAQKTGKVEERVSVQKIHRRKRTNDL